MGSEQFVPTRFQEFASVDGRFALHVGDKQVSELFSRPGDGFSIHFSKSAEPFKEDILTTRLDAKTISVPHLICRNTFDFFLRGSGETESFVPTAAEACALLAAHNAVLRNKDVVGRLYPPELLIVGLDELPVEQYMLTNTESDGQRVVVGYFPQGVMEVKDPDRRLLLPPGVFDNQKQWFGVNVDVIDQGFKNTKLGSMKAFMADLRTY